jgi:hypothetical protein
LFDGDNDIEEARGCGNEAFYECHHFQKNPSVASCTGVPQVPPGILR